MSTNKRRMTLIAVLATVFLSLLALTACAGADPATPELLPNPYENTGITITLRDNMGNEVNEPMVSGVYTIEIDGGSDITNLLVYDSRRGGWESIPGGHWALVEFRADREQRTWAAYGSTDGGETWTDYNIREYNFTRLGGLYPPTATITGGTSTFDRGSTVPVTVGKIQNATEYRLYVRPASGENQYTDVFEFTKMTDGSGEGSLTFQIPTNHLPAGDYKLWVTIFGLGYNSNQTDPVIFTVQQPAGYTQQAAIYVYPENTLAGEPFMIYAYIPEAEYCEIWRRMGGNSGQPLFKGNPEGEYICLERTIEFGGTFNILAYTDPSESPVATTQVTVTSYGPLNPIQMVQDVPKYVPINEAMELQFYATEHAEEYNISLVCETNEGPGSVFSGKALQSEAVDGVITVTIPGTSIAQEGKYILSISAKATGYMTNGKQYQFLTENAAGDGIILWYEDMPIIENGFTAMGKIQYKFYVENLPVGCTSLQFAWSEDMSVQSLENWGDDWRALQEDKGGKYFYVMPEMDGNYDQEVMFVRTGENDPNPRRIEIQYNRHPRTETEFVITSGTPTWNAQYTLQWEEASVNGVTPDFYAVWWRMPNDEIELRFCGPNQTQMTEDWYATQMDGTHYVQVFAIKDDQILQQSAPMTFSFIPPLFLAGDNEEFVQVNEQDGSVTIKTNQWVNFTVHAPCANSVRLYALDSAEGIPENAQAYASANPDKGGDVYFRWKDEGTTVNNYTKYMRAEICYPGGKTVVSDPVTVHVVRDGTIAANITYTVPGNVNTAGENGVWQVERDGLLYVDVNNYVLDDNGVATETPVDADFFGLYIPGAAAGDNWIADSHLIPVSDGQTTRVALPVSRCEVNENGYQVKVFAVKYGAPRKEAGTSIPIHVTAEKDPTNPIIISMGREYVTGDTLRVFAHYTNPQNITGEMEIRIRNKNDENDILLEEKGEFEDYYVETICWHEGTFVVDARIWRYGDQGATVIDDHPEMWEFTVSAPDGDAAPPAVLGSVNDVEFVNGGEFTVTGITIQEKEGYSYFSDIFGTTQEEDGSFVLDEEQYYTGVDMKNGKFVFPMGLQNDQVGPGTVAIVFGCAKPGQNEVHDFEHPYYFNVWATPELEIRWDKAQTDGYDYEIPVHTEFTVCVDTYGAVSATLDLGDGYNLGPIQLDEYEEWWNGEWGEHHEKVQIKVAYDVSCDDQETYQVKVTTKYGNPAVGEVTQTSKSYSIYCSSEGEMDVSSWEPVAYYDAAEKTRSGDVYISFESGGEGWEAVPATGIEIERGKLLSVIDLKESAVGIGGTGFFGTLLRADNDGDANWRAGMYDVAVSDGNEWLMLSTAKFADLESDTINGVLWLSTWKDGWDSKEKTYPVRITNTKATGEEVFWSFSGADANGNVTKQTNEWIRFSVFVPGADFIDVTGYDENGEKAYENGYGGDLYVDTGWTQDAPCVLTFTASGKTVDGAPFSYTYPGTITITSKGDLPAPVVTLTGNADDNTVVAGEDITFTFVENPGLDEFFAGHGDSKDVWYNAYLYNENWDEVCEPLEKIKPGDPLEFETDNLELNNVYRLSVDVQQIGYTGVATDEWVLVLPEGTGETTPITLAAVDGLSNDGTVPVNQNVTFRLVATNPEKIKYAEIYNGDEWRRFDSKGEENLWETQFSFTEDRLYPVYARVELMDEKNPAFTSILRVTATKTGTTGTFTYSTDMPITEGRREITRGIPVTVTYTKAANADHYWIDIEEYDEKDREWNWVTHEADLYTERDSDPQGNEQAGTVALMTATLESGKHYRMFAVADATGYLRAETEYTEFEVIEPDNPGVMLSVYAGENNTIQTGDKISVSVYSPGADGIDLLYDTLNDGWKDGFDSDSFSTEVSPYWTRGTYSMKARAWYPVYENGQPVWVTDEEGNLRLDKEGRKIQEHYPIDSEPVTITVLADGENIPIEATIPSYLAVGSNLAFTVEWMDDAGWMDATISVQNEDGFRWDEDSYQWDIHEEGLAVSIPWNNLEEMGMHAGQTLVINIGCGKAGHDIRGLERLVPIINMPSGTTEAIIAFDEPDESTPGVLNALVNTETGLTISKPEGRTPRTITVDGQEITEKDTIQNVRLFNGHGFLNAEDPKEDGIYRTTVNFGESGIYSVYALVTYMQWEDAWAGLNEDPRVWYPTNVLTINATKNGDVNPFTIELASSVKRGETVQVKITQPENGNATDFDLRIEDTEEEGYWADEKNGIMAFETVNLRPGTYRVRVTGHAENLENYSVRKLLTVTEPDQSILFNVNGGTESTEILIGEAARVNILAPDAIRIGFWVDGHPWHLDEQGNYNWGNDMDSWHSREEVRWIEKDDLKEHTLQAGAQFTENGEWVMTDPIEVTVSSVDELAFSTFNIPSYFTAGSVNDQEITISLPENAESMNIRVYQATENEQAQDGWNREKIAEINECKDAVRTLTIPKGYLTEGAEIWIDLRADGTGYIPAEEHVSIPVLPAPAVSGGATLTLDGLDKDGNARINTTIHATVTPAEGRTLTEIRFFGGYGFLDNGIVIYSENRGWFRDGVFDAGLEISNQDDIGRTLNVYAYYKQNGDTDWSITNVGTMKIVSLGTVGAFDFAQDQLRTVTAVRGDSVTFRFGTADNAEYYRIYLKDANGEIIRPDSTYKDLVGTIRTWNVPAGTYAVYGWAGSQGWVGTESTGYVTLTITEPTDGINLTVSKEPDSQGQISILTQETLEWWVYAPGAASLAVEGYFVDENEQRNYFFQRDNIGWDWEGFDSSVLSGQDGFGGYVGTAYIDVTATYANGTTKKKSLTITATAPNGDLTAAAITANRYDGSTLTLGISPDSRTQIYGYSIRIQEVSTPNGNILYETQQNRSERGDWSQTFNNLNNAPVQVEIHQKAKGYNDSYQTVTIFPINTNGLIQLPASLTTIEEEAFENNTGITHVVIPGNVTAIGDHAFSGCGNMHTIEIPATVTSFGQDVFGDRGDLTIYGTGGSQAETYANTYGISFVRISDN